MGYPDTFTGFCVDGPKTWNKFHKAELTPKKFGDHDIDVQIDACGVCGSDVHSITGGWGDFEGPLCVGHEVVGKAVKVGTHVKGIKEGDRVGVGAQVWACLECDLCKDKNENYCPKQYFTFKIPDKLETHVAAPLLCAGITTYSPLVRAGVGKGSKVGVIGIGGLGHLAVQWAVALGADVYAISHSPDKAEDCKKLGAKEVILTNKDDWAEEWKLKFDFILNASDMTHKFDMATHLQLLRPGGEFHMVGLPDEALPQLTAFMFAGNAPKLTGSHLGNHQEMEEMLQLAADKGLHPWVETIDISEKGCQEAVERVKENKVHYRFTLTGFDKAFGRT
ncbi:hypothetical protein NLU13_9642 [Sarocladium strictum]|uniref:Enoyl reductase (ER) domain-containing protein n=1 Tax=Sarocladium strictum TaxID=5046 RepID=A0AA39L421_SARSR|nr:hypothetical protein NLU13_9642 [Sarocladium strictum]